MGYSEIARGQVRDRRACNGSAPSCDHFGRHGEWKKFLATKILAKVGGDGDHFTVKGRYKGTF